jgi:hypothetical protein
MNWKAPQKVNKGKIHTEAARPKDSIREKVQKICAVFQ